MALRNYNGAGLPPAPGQDPDNMADHRVKPMPPPRMPPPPTAEQIAAQKRLLGEVDAADVAPPLLGPRVAGPPDSPEVRYVPVEMSNETQVLEWPFSGTVWLTLNAQGQLDKATIQLTGERGTVVKEGATVAEAAIAALAEFEEQMAKEDLREMVTRVLAEATDQQEAVDRIMQLVQGGQQ